MSAEQERKAARRGIFGKYAYGWLTLAFFLGSLALHWYFGWQAYVSEAQEHGQVPAFPEYLDEMLRDTFENWQSEFLQLLWQVVGLTILLYVGSPQSKESEDRTEEMLKEILRKVDPKGAEATLAELDQKYPAE